VPSAWPAWPLLLALGTGGCVYRMTVQQGNFLDPKQVSQLQVGMTRSQVRFLLGTPMLPDAFDRDRWDYLYYEKIGRLKKPDQRRLTVFFDPTRCSVSRTSARRSRMSRQLQPSPRRYRRSRLPPRPRRPRPSQPPPRPDTPSAGVPPARRRAASTRLRRLARGSACSGR
jgi:outer membrane protein assembly factor BamE